MESRRFIVAPGQEFSYPADAESLQLVKQAGGRLKLSEEAQKRLRFKTVREGENCSDMPAEALETYLERGWVLEVHGEAGDK